jgi:hypothetical protein
MVGAGNVMLREMEPCWEASCDGVPALIGRQGRLEERVGGKRRSLGWRWCWEANCDGGAGADRMPGTIGRGSRGKEAKSRMTLVLGSEL